MVIGFGSFADIIIRGGLTYTAKVAKYTPIAHWVQGEADGVTAVEQINSPAQDGTYTGVTLGQAGIGDGNTCPLFPLQPNFVDLYTATLSGAYDGSEGSVMIWFKVFNAGVWTDGAQRQMVNLRGSGGGLDFIRIYKDTANNRYYFWYRANGVIDQVLVAASPTDWVCALMTWSAAADQMKAYVNGAQTGSTKTGLGAWTSGALKSTETCLGTSWIGDGRAPWYGWLAHCALWDTPLAPAQVADLAIV